MTTNGATTCVEYVCKYYKVRTSSTQVSNSINAIVDALKFDDFFACEIRTHRQGLIDCPKPAIVQTTSGFVVVVKSNTAGVTVIDPSDGALHRIAFPDFVKLWTGIVVVIEPPPRQLSFFEKIFGG